MQTSRTLLNCVEIFCARSYSSSLSTMTTLCRRHATGARSLISLSCLNLTSKRLMSYRQAERRNLVIRFVPHQEAWIVERMGKFNRTLNPVSWFKTTKIASVKLNFFACSLTPWLQAS